MLGLCSREIVLPLPLTSVSVHCQCVCARAVLLLQSFCALLSFFHEMIFISSVLGVGYFFLMCAHTALFFLSLFFFFFSQALWFKCNCVTEYTHWFDPFFFGAFVFVRVTLLCKEYINTPVFVLVLFSSLSNSDFTVFYMDVIL